MNAREKLDEFAEINGMNKNQPIGWSIAADFAEWYVEQVKNCSIPAVTSSTVWELKGHSHQIADTGDYDGHYEITNGKISLLTKDDDDEALMPIIDALNNSGCKFYQDDWFEFENSMLKEEIKKLKFMIENGLGWKDMEKDISPIHDI